MNPSFDIESHRAMLLEALELERREEEARHRAARENLSLRERKARGLTLGGLDVRDERVGLGGRWLVLYATQHDIGDGFRPGAVVELCAEGVEPAVGVVSRVGLGELEVAFDDRLDEAFEGGRAVLELCPSDVTHRALVQAVRGLTELGKGEERGRREVWLGMRAPQPPEREEPTTHHSCLNPEQQLAATRAWQARDLYLVHGPPGTGKSTVLIEVAKMAAAKGEKVLATAASNAAVDNLLEGCLAAGLEAVRVGHPARVNEALRARTLDVLAEEHPERRIAKSLFSEALSRFAYARKQRARGRSRERFALARAAVEEGKALMREARDHERRAVDAVLARAAVICATCTGAATPPVSRLVFDRVLFDEAAQATEPSAWLALARGGAVVMAGDHCQLPPTVLSPAAQERGLGRSLFERLMAINGERASTLLCRQYRMHAEIMAWSSQTFYGGQLVADVTAAARGLSSLEVGGAPLGGDLDAPPLLFLDTAGRGFDECLDDESASVRNVGEAQLIVLRVLELVQGGVAPGAIGVIAPYIAQVQEIRRRLKGTPGGAVECSTVDGFQGREKEVILLSMTRSNDSGSIGFLDDLRRMNVAMTRARRHLFVVGDSATLSVSSFYEGFVQHCQQTDGYRSVWSWPGAESL